MKNCFNEVPRRAALIFAAACRWSGRSIVVRICHNFGVTTVYFRKGSL